MYTVCVCVCVCVIRIVYILESQVDLHVTFQSGPKKAVPGLHCETIPVSCLLVYRHVQLRLHLEGSTGKSGAACQ